MRLIIPCLSRFPLLVVLLGLAACGVESPSVPGQEPVEVARIEGSVFYRERIMLPPGIEVEVQLQDISRADAMATVLATVTSTPQGGPPYGFVIEYDPTIIDSRMRYALRATISNGEQLLFSSTDYIDPFESNPVEILVHRVPESVRREGPSLEGVTWILDSLAGESPGPGAGGAPVNLQFSAQEKRASGFSGCNRYTGGYAREGANEYGSALKIGPVAGTLMACQEGAELEQRYLGMLDRVTAFRLDGDTLSLLAGPEVLATFKSS